MVVVCYNFLKRKHCEPNVNLIGNNLPALIVFCWHEESMLDTTITPGFYFLQLTAISRQPDTFGIF